MKILVAGTGAVGGFYGAKLVRSDESVTFLARGKILAALQRNPLVIRSHQGDFSVSVTAVDSVDSLLPQDLILICVKGYDTDVVLEQIRPVVGPDTLLLSLQNGVENEPKMVTAFGPQKVLGAVCYIGAEVIEPGVVLHNARGSVAIGEIDGSVTERLKRIVEVFKKAKIDVELSTEIQKELWTKLAWNSAFNQLCTIARATVGQALDSSPLKDLLRATMREVAAVALKNGVSLGEETIDESLKLSSDELRSVKPSMLQDLEKGKRLEHESFSGFLVREGRRWAVPVPVNEVLTRFLGYLDAVSREKTAP